MVPKDKLEEFSTYKRLKDKDYKETNESSIIYQSRIDNGFKHDKESVLSKKFLEWAFNYIKTGSFPEKLLKNFTNKSTVKQRKKNFRTLVGKNKRLRIETKEIKGFKVEILSKNWKN